MIRRVISFVLLGLACEIGWAQDASAQGRTAAGQAQTQAGSSKEPAEHAAIRARMKEYIETFNKCDSAALCSHWTGDCVSLDEETGERTTGRDSLTKDFTTFFEANPTAHLNGELTVIRMIRPDVATVEGQTTLFIDDQDPVQSAYSAVLVKEGDQWLISSSQERDIPTPPTPYDALKELEWLIGTWHDNSDEVYVDTTVRWSSNRAFMIRSFNADFQDGDVLQGTEVIGWDPLSKQIRTWTFNSNGSFGEATVSKNGEDWMLKTWQILADGRLASATRVITRTDDDTITMRTIGETVDGEPAPASDPVTVVRVETADDVSSTETPASQGGTR